MVDISTHSSFIYTSGVNGHSLDIHATLAGEKISKTGTWGVAPNLKQVIRAKVVDRKKPKPNIL